MKAVGPIHPNTIFYMAVPPSLVETVSRAIAGAGLLHCSGR